MIHRLKVWPRFFDDLASGAKKFEVRRDDRGFEVGDQLDLAEYDPASDRFTGRQLRVDVTYVLRPEAIPDGPLRDGFVVLGIYR